MDLRSDKGALRTAIDSRRASLPLSEHHTRDELRTRHVLAQLTISSVAALYASRPGEPGTVALTRELRARGWRILLPKLRKQPDWAWATTNLTPGWAGIPEPTGPGLGAEILAEADLIVVPCLAVALDGTRLGTGGGWYDRALPYCRAEARIWALANADEVMATLPREPHDLPIHAVVTEAGFTPLGHGDVS